MQQQLKGNQLLSFTKAVAVEGLGVDDGGEMSERLRLQVERLRKVDSRTHAPFRQNCQKGKVRLSYSFFFFFFFYQNVT